ncbi:hypothetical protein [Bradyrhizobium sp. LTSP857]|uniref:hypothetical protein n=1 Tax=Bradyrhizobium sp. LTSP857 TaxID=1619231 RepID=UPI001FD8E4C4|nr:hypothetical protein [Bradyrhizobium sp. LTSP857]
MASRSRLCWKSDFRSTRGLIKTAADAPPLAQRQSCNELHDSTMQLQSTRDRIRLRDGIDRPRIWKDMAMTLSFRFVARPAVALPSIALMLCCLNGTAMSQPTPLAGADTLPGVTVDAPKQVVRPPRPAHHLAARSTGSRTSPSISTATAPMSDTVKLAKLERETGSCVGGCQSSFKTANQPWVGCNATGGVYSATCRNVGNYKSYDECKEAGRVTGWRSGETMAYCSSVALAAGWR